ncbi:uncharacterized protein T551_02641 [Pneumocystis jirovecii RU7]|uniref:Uncharacterized protein n=1 Tax=Pneumocystis jirovecii (strain RU7) TaxID=1408657 RepID=A0A0W4ZIP1_PNEJ7|nr:uncharacterized protein T551_02641 [Pneumocystis jirovecii RU7]KTW28222.1 hypothetical protein T551_02641 [Pneumocystis jirovecii RU7]
MDEESIFFNKKFCENEKVLISDKSMDYQKKTDALLRLKGLVRRIFMLRRFRLKRRFLVSRPFNFVYLQLLNQVIRETAADVDLEITKNDLDPSIVCGNMWSSLEKEKFFKSLSRRSRHNPEDIARDVGSKSVMQVIGYMNILEEESQMLRLSNRKSGEEVSLRHIPAAMEMSDKWINVEEQEAKKIQKWTDKLQERQEKVTWGPEWSFLENRKTHEIEMAWNFVNESFISIQEPLFEVSPEICFLRPKSFIELSEKLFFNRDIDSPSKEIVLYRTTLMHMYELARRLTRRLVQTVYFIALSRLRAESSSNFHSRYVVRSKDVQMAVDILRLNRNSDSYWLNLPRRIKMTVLDENGQKLNFDQVENKLSRIPLSTLRRRGKEVSLYDSFSSIKNKHIDFENNFSTAFSITDCFQANNSENTIENLDDPNLLKSSLLSSVQKNAVFNDNYDDLSVDASESSDDDEIDDMLVNVEDEFLEVLDAKRSAINECELWRKFLNFYKFGKINIVSPKSRWIRYMDMKEMYEEKILIFD